MHGKHRIEAMSEKRIGLGLRPGTYRSDEAGDAPLFGVTN